MPMSRRNGGIFERGMVAVFWPFTISVPRVGRSITATSLRSVLLPAPECPVRNTISPRATDSVRFEMASRPFG